VAAFNTAEEHIEMLRNLNRDVEYYMLLVETTKLEV
jgi:hypothetical protein